MGIPIGLDLSFLTESPAIEQALQSLRLCLRDNLHLATTVGYGPRFLHSIGQFHKGGPNIGLFLQLPADADVDAHVSGEAYTFSIFKQAQALGDLEALHRHLRRAIRIHLGEDVIGGLTRLEKIVEASLREAVEVAVAGG